MWSALGRLVQFWRELERVLKRLGMVVRMDSYHRWMEVTLTPTMAGLPVLAVPAGFGGPDRLQIGIQLIAPRNADLAVLQLGDPSESASPWIAGTPPPVLFYAVRRLRTQTVGECDVPIVSTATEK